MSAAQVPTILSEAAELTAGDRNRYYGHPADNHGNTAEMWASYLERRFGERLPLTARDVCMMMVLLKVSRDANAVMRDNLVDICGYARNAEMIEERERSLNSAGRHSTTLNSAAPTNDPAAPP